MKKLNSHKRTYNFFKRFFDIICSFFAIVVLLPVYIILGVIVKCTSKGPVFYSHKRIGKNGKEISVIKFRSMVKNADKMIDTFSEEQKKEFKENFKLHNDPRVTKFGKLLRKTSLDELPQLFNIFTGNISIVGPRPITQEETLLYGENRDLLLSVKPGLTGPWAINGRSSITYNKRIELELQYVNECSFWYDFKIIFKTIIPVFKGHGAK